MTTTCRSPRRRAVLLTSIAVLTALCLTSCTSDTACPAVAYSSTAHITLAEPRDGLTLRLCTGNGCDYVAARGALEDLTSEVLFPPGTSATGWSADLMFAPSPIGYRLTDPDGVIVTEGSVVPEWQRVGGSAECGGPRRALIEVPA